MSGLEQLFAQNSAKQFVGYTQNIIALISSQGDLIEWNPAFNKLITAQPSATRLQDHLAESSRDLFFELMAARVSSPAHLQLQSDVGVIDFNCLLTPLPEGNFLFCAEPIWTHQDKEFSRLAEELVKTSHSLKIKKIELESVLAQADEVSHTDALTFLANRRRIIADLQRDVSNSDSYNKPLTILMADIDYFKRVNDTYGHAAGDQVLRTVSGAMLASIRQIDKLGRYGGEEFLFILPATTKSSALKLADRLLQVVRSLVINLHGEQSIQATISIGLAQYRVRKESWDELLNRADKALYESKKNGRDRWTIS